MIEKVREGFEQLDISAANEVLGLDRELDRTRHAIFRRHLAARHPSLGSMSVEALSIAQALERAGGHTTNLAEELLHLIEGRSFGHMPKREASEN